MENLSEYLLVLQLFYYLRVLGGSTAKLKGTFFNKMSEIRSSDPTINKARKSATDNYYRNKNPGTNIDSVKAFINQKIGSLQNKPNANNNLLLDKFVKALKFLNDNYTKDGVKKGSEKEQDNNTNQPNTTTKPGTTDSPAPLVQVKPAPQAKPAPAQPKYKTREEVVQELMSQGKITDPSQAVALSSPVTVNGRTFQALISPLGTLPGPGGVRVPIINDQQANSYAMSLLKEYHTLAGFNYQPLNENGKKSLDPKNIEPLKKLLARIDLAVKNKTSHEQTASGEPILPQMREPKLSADTENLYKILKRLSGQTLDSIAQPDKAKSSVEPAVDNSSGPFNQVKKNDLNTTPVSQTSVISTDSPNAAVNTNKVQISGTVPGPDLSLPPLSEYEPKVGNPQIAKDDTNENITDPKLVIDSSSLYFKDDTGKLILGTNDPTGFFEFILDYFENSDYYNSSNNMTEAEFIKRVSNCKTPQDKNNKNKCWTEFPKFMLGKLSSILGTYRTPDNKIYKTLTKFIPLGVTLNIEMIMNLIEANDQRYSNLSESFIGVK